MGIEEIARKDDAVILPAHESAGEMIDSSMKRLVKLAAETILRQWRSVTYQFATARLYRGQKTS